MQSKALRLSNSQRLRKKEHLRQDFQSGCFIKKISQHDYYQGIKRRNKYHHQYSYCAKYGYEEDQQMQPVLKQLKDTFDAKLELCFPKYFVRDMGRKDKYERAEKLGFKPKKNPVLTLFQTLNKKLVKPVLGEAMEKIKGWQVKKNKYYLWQGEGRAGSPNYNY